MHTFYDLKYDICQRLGDTSNARLNKVGKYINLKYQEIWDSHLWKDKIILDEQVSTTAADPIVVIPQRIQQILAITDRGISQVLTFSAAPVFQRQFVLDITSTGSALAYTSAGTRGVKTDLSSAGTVKIVSDNASDAANIFIEGRDANDNKKSETLTLTGTTAVSGSVTFTHIDHWTKDADTLGTITLTDSSDNVLDYLDYDKSCNRYVLIRIGLTPGESGTLYVTGCKRFIPLVNDNDCIAIPAYPAVFYAGLAEAHSQDGDESKAAVAMQQAQSALANIIGSEDVMSDSAMAIVPEVQYDYTDKPL